MRHAGGQLTRRNLILILAATTALSALALTAARARDVPKVATGFVANVLCSETFVSGLDPDAGLRRDHCGDAWHRPDRLGARLSSVDRARKDVTVTLFGLGRSHAVYRGEGFGCYLDHGGAVADIAVPAADASGGAAARYRRARRRRAADAATGRRARPRLCRAGQSPPRNTRAVVVVKDGRVVAERYADGIGIDTPLLGFSATKSVISALAGILVRKGALKLRRACAGRGVARRRTIRGMPSRVDHLLRHTAGLALGSSLQASLASALEPVNRMKFMEADMAAYAESMPLETAPGSAWNYHDGNTVILSHLIRKAAGGSASDMMRFARQRIVRSARHAQRDARVRRVGQCGRIEPDAGERARLGALRPALSQ